MGRAFEYRKASKMARWDKMAKTFSKIGLTNELNVSLVVLSLGSNINLIQAIEINFLNCNTT